MRIDDEDQIFRVLINREEQYSIWPDYRALPIGWQDVGVKGDRKACFDYIESVWTDKRPLSLRKHMQGRYTGKPGRVETTGADSTAQGDAES